MKYALTALFWGFCVSLPALFAADTLKSTGGYLELENLKRLHRDLMTSWDPLALVVEVKYQNRSVRFKPAEKFYTSGPFMVALETPAQLRHGKVWLPNELVEEIITELNLPVRYSFLQSGLKVKQQQTPRRGDGTTSAKPLSGAFQSKVPEIIVLDAGHGGKDPGAYGALESVEKDITLQTTRELARHLKNIFPASKVVLVRSRDKFISLEDRSQVANKYFSNEKNTIFLSIHCNATLSPKVRGFEIYYLAVNPSNMSSRETELRENRVAGSKHIRALSSRLINASIQFESKTLARVIEKSMKVELQGKVESRGVRKADFAVLRGSLMPSVLIELGYITNRQEAQMLQSAEFRAAFNQAIAEAITEYSRRLP